MEAVKTRLNQLPAVDIGSEGTARQTLAQTTVFTERHKSCYPSLINRQPDTKCMTGAHTPLPPPVALHA